MRPKHSPTGKVITAILLLVSLLALAAAAVLQVPRLSPTRMDEKTTLSVLHSEAMTFLVTRRTATQIVVEHDERHWAGEWRGVLWATVRLHYGVDLKKLQASDIRREGEVIIVRLPEPELLDFAVEPGSEGFLSKSTAVAKIQDILRNGQRRQLEQRLRERALEFASEHDLLPGRDEIVRQLNATTSALKLSSGVILRFE